MSGEENALKGNANMFSLQDVFLFYQGFFSRSLMTHMIT